MTNETSTSIPVDFDPFAAGRIDTVVPVTAAQREIWIASQVSPESSCAFNQSIVVRLPGLLDDAALERAVATVIELRGCPRDGSGVGHCPARSRVRGVAGVRPAKVRP